MGLFKKFVELGTDAKYVSLSRRCDICSQKLTFFETGFWSINAKQLTDGVVCKHCYEKLELLAQYRTACIPSNYRKETPFSNLTPSKLCLLDVQSAKSILEYAEDFAKQELSQMDSAFRSVFRSKEICFIQPSKLDVGIKRAEILSGKLVLFGFVQLGTFKQGDRVIILDGKHQRETEILEAYPFDCEKNTLERELKAHMGKQQLCQWQSGWLVLNDTDTVAGHETVAGENKI